MILNKKQITSHVEQKEIHYTGTLGNFNHFKNADNHNNSYENNSKNTNPINLQLSFTTSDVISLLIALIK